MRRYHYVGPEELRQSAAPGGAVIVDAGGLDAWLRQHPEGRSEGATFVGDLEGRLRLAPRRSEHVVCAGGAPVLAAGEAILRDRTGRPPTLTEVIDPEAPPEAAFLPTKSIRAIADRLGEVR